MPTLRFLGHACFRIADRGVKLLIDPCPPETGYRIGRQKVDLLLITHPHPNHAYERAARGAFRIDGPGEYEVKGVFIQGFGTYHDRKKGKERGKNTVFLIEIGGVRIAHLGDLGHPLGDETLDALNGVDVLLVPVGGRETLDAEGAVEVISQIEPRLVIPMHYRGPQGEMAHLAPLEEFLAEMGVSQPERLPELKVTRSSLPAPGEEARVVVLVPLGAEGAEG